MTAPQSDRPNEISHRRLRIVPPDEAGSESVTLNRIDPDNPDLSDTTRPHWLTNFLNQSQGEMRRAMPSLWAAATYLRTVILGKAGAHRDLPLAVPRLPTAEVRQWSPTRLPEWTNDPENLAGSS